MNNKLFKLICFSMVPLMAAGCDGGNSTSTDTKDNVKYIIDTGDLPFRDICILPDTNTNLYYMIGFLKSASSAQEIACYQSKDLKKWGNYTTAMYNDGVYDQSWAPELHMYKGEYYCFASLKKHTIDNSDLRGCYILKAPKANGVYEEYSARITPKNWECLDGTLYVEDGVPYMVYCREWTRFVDHNGEMYCVRLKDDLTDVYPGAEHKKLFSAKDHPASDDGVTDGCYMYKANNGDLVMFWSKYINGSYAIITSRSTNGKIDGTWIHDETPLFTRDGGHAMIFKDFNGNLRIAFHVQSGNKGNEVPVVYTLKDDNGKLSIIEE